MKTHIYLLLPYRVAKAHATFMTSPSYDTFIKKHIADLGMIVRSIYTYLA